jgi:hypothetical protein
MAEIQLPKSNLGDIAAVLCGRYRHGLAGEKDGLVTALVLAGLNHHDAVSTTSDLERSGYAVFLPGQRSCWLFLHRPIALRELMQSLQLEYPAAATHPNHSQSAAEFIAGRWLIDHDVANELLRAFEAAGYTRPSRDPHSYTRFVFPETVQMR